MHQGFQGWLGRNVLRESLILLLPKGDGFEVLLL